MPTIKELEALSIQQQKDRIKGLPAEGGYFTMDVGEGADKLYQRRGGNIVGLGFDYPTDWGGQTIGAWQNKQTSAGLASLQAQGIDVSRLKGVDAAYVRESLKSGDLKESGLTDLSKFLSESGSYQPSGSNILASPISPSVPESLTPESSLAGIRSVFGANWQPSPAFTPELQAKGIFGAVRVGDSPNVFTLGKGGGLESAESFLQKFGTSEQEGIVGEISREQAIALGVTDTKQTPIAPGGVTPEALTPGGDVIELPDGDGGGGGTTYNADTTIAGIEEYIKLQEESKTAAEKAKETELETEKDLFKDLLEESEGRGAAQLSEEEAQGVIAKQEAVDDANGALQIKMAEINSLELSYNKKITTIEGKPISQGRMQGQEAQEYRMFLADKGILVAEAGLLQATALASQQKLDSAITAASRAVDLRWSDYKQRLDNQVTLLNLLQGELTDIQQTRADALSNYYDQQKTAIDAQIVAEKANYNTLLDIIQKYPDAQATLQDTIEEANAKVVANSAIYRQQTRLADTTPTPTIVPEPELTGMDAAIRDAANDVISMESVGMSTNESYWKIVDEIAEASGRDRNYIDKLLIQKIQQTKGQPTETISQVEENIGSDFLTEEETLGGTTQDEKSRESARQKAIQAGLKMFLDPITGKIVNV